MVEISKALEVRYYAYWSEYAVKIERSSRVAAGKYSEKWAALHFYANPTQITLLICRKEIVT
jgi:hypothetical protein